MIALIVLFSSAVKSFASLPYKKLDKTGAAASAPPAESQAVNASFPPAAATAAPRTVWAKICAVLPSASLDLKY